MVEPATPASKKVIDLFDKIEKGVQRDEGHHQKAEYLQIFTADV